MHAPDPARISEDFQRCADLLSRIETGPAVAVDLARSGNAFFGLPAGRQMAAQFSSSLSFRRYVHGVDAAGVGLKVVAECGRLLRVRE